MLAVGLGGFEKPIDSEFDAVAQGGAVFKAVRGEYGSGKTFFARWLAECAKRRGFTAAEVQISRVREHAEEALPGESPLRPPGTSPDGSMSEGS